MSSFDRQAIIDSLSRLVTPGIKLTALADELGARKQEYSELRSLILELVEEGIVHVLPGGAFALAPSGRPVDPHAKPVPAPAAPGPRASGLGPRPEKKQRAAKELKRKAKLPWRPKPATTEYDPDTGEVREIGSIPRAVARSPKPEAPRPPQADEITGRITVHPAGYGFVATDHGETVFVPA